MSTQQVNYLINVTGNLQAKLDQATKGFDKLDKEVDGLKKKLGKASGSGGSGLAGSLAGIGGVIAGAFAADQVIQFGKDVFAITAEFQKFEAVLTNTLGSKSEAQKSLAMIQDFAANTPFAVTELSDSFVKLANRGFVPVENQMRQLGDLASSVGKPFDQLTEAILDAQTGEFERLKEFGIKARKEGDKVTFSFKGQSQTVQNSEQAIRDYILALGDAQGVSGAMAAISQTLEGQVSNLGDNFDSLKLAIGNALAGETGESIGMLNSLVTFLKNNVGSLVESIKDLFRPMFNIFKTVTSLLPSFGGLTKSTDLLANTFKLFTIQTRAAWWILEQIINGFVWFLKLVKDAAKAVLQFLGVFEKVKLLANSIKILIENFENIPLVLDAAWGAFKDFYKGLLDLTLNTGNSIFNILKESLDVKKILSGDKSGINAAIGDAVKQVNTDLSKLSINANFQTRLQESLRKKELQKLKTAPEIGGNTLASTSAGAIAGTDTELTKVDDEVTGTKATNINLNIDKLIENLNFNTTSLQESTTKIKEEVTRVLIEALRDTTAIATN